MNSSDDRVTEAIHRALTHSLRREILLILRTKEKPMSPIDLVPEVEGSTDQKKLSKIAYHVRELHKAGLLELVKTEPVRGTAKHFYRPTKLFTAKVLDMLALDAIAELLENEASNATEDILEKIVGILAASGRPIRPT